MHTVERLDYLLAVARQLGYQIRREWLDGQGGGCCEFANQRWIFLDLALSVPEQLELLTEVLREQPAVHELDLPDSVRNQLMRPTAA